MKKILATGGLAMFAMGAIAADNPGWYLTPKLGHTITDNDRRADDAPAFGLGIGRYLNDRWAFELSGLAGDHDRSPSGDLDLTSLSVDVQRVRHTSDLDGLCHAISMLACTLLVNPPRALANCIAGHLAC